MAEEQIQVRVTWEPDSDKPAYFTNHMFVTYDGAVYTLRFYQLLPPVVAGLDAAAVNTIDSVSARHITTLVVPAATLPSIVRALQDVLKKAENPEL